ncbi:hypothetical protein SO3561_09092 [Streptomyces olivochromogenes]|uniref:Uncharacterized protein n=1 Tax=Streptomyces olivochromogenes TaxID=1963 RepID=A0A250VU16_STROL|nr:hypothetical protein SO3561_09092 [Streptomyces olivochromogenes]
MPLDLSEAKSHGRIVPERSLSWAEPRCQLATLEAAEARAAK